VPNVKNIAKKPIVKKKSPTLLVNIAFIALLTAAILVYQKCTKRYEQIPTPSQPINITKKLLPVTSININPVNKDI